MLESDGDNSEHHVQLRILWQLQADEIDARHVQRNGRVVRQFIAQGIKRTDQTTQAIEQQQRRALTAD